MMKNGNTPPVTHPNGFQEIVSWVHCGDLHMTTRDQKNYRDLQALIDEVNGSMTGSIDFIYLPGDNADHGKPEEYEAVRDGLDRLLLPWHSIIGDHDVHPRSFDNYLRYMSQHTYYDFKVGDYQFLALNAFDAAGPQPFDLLSEQLGWLEQHLADASTKNSAVCCSCTFTRASWRQPRNRSPNSSGSITSALSIWDIRTTTKFRMMARRSIQLPAQPARLKKVRSASR
jgi:3',5'-cyclic AMP phosphodiesterase CpdA